MGSGHVSGDNFVKRTFDLAKMSQSIDFMKGAPNLLKILIVIQHLNKKTPHIPTIHRKTQTFQEKISDIFISKHIVKTQSPKLLKIPIAIRHLKNPKTSAMNASMSPPQADHDRRIGRPPDRVSTDLFTKDLCI
jgi:hypothetical protein